MERNFLDPTALVDPESIQLRTQLQQLSSSMWLGFAANLIGLWGAIGLIRLKEWGRKIGIAWAGFIFFERLYALRLPGVRLQALAAMLLAGCFIFVLTKKNNQLIALYKSPPFRARDVGVVRGIMSAWRSNIGQADIASIGCCTT